MLKALNLYWDVGTPDAGLIIIITFRLVSCKRVALVHTCDGFHRFLLIIIISMRTTRRRAMAQAVGRWLVIAESWVYFQVSPLAFVVDRVTLEQYFIRVLWFILPASFSQFSIFIRLSSTPYNLSG
jgi:hypothetical protein